MNFYPSSIHEYLTIFSDSRSNREEFSLGLQPPQNTTKQGLGPEEDPVWTLVLCDPSSDLENCLRSCDYVIEIGPASPKEDKPITATLAGGVEREDSVLGHEHRDTSNRKPLPLVLVATTLIGRAQLEKSVLWHKRPGTSIRQPMRDAIDVYGKQHAEERLKRNVCWRLSDAILQYGNPLLRLLLSYSELNSLMPEILSYMLSDSKPKIQDGFTRRLIQVGHMIKPDKDLKFVTTEWIQERLQGYVMGLANSASETDRTLGHLQFCLLNVILEYSRGHGTSRILPEPRPGREEEVDAIALFLGLKHANHRTRNQGI